MMNAVRYNDIDGDCLVPVPVFLQKIDDVAVKYIHPYKQAILYDVISNVRDMNSVEQLWIFGSAVTRNHMPWSDLDILLIGDVCKEDYSRVVELIDSRCDYDILKDTKERFRLYQNQFAHCYWRILREGVKFYDTRWFE